jgi:hypothetical protein
MIVALFRRERRLVLHVNQGCLETTITLKMESGRRP